MAIVMFKRGFTIWNVIAIVLGVIVATYYWSQHKGVNGDPTQSNISQANP
jgi:ACR3 family arsenite efflux pump ArsB